MLKKCRFSALLLLFCALVVTNSVAQNRRTDSLLIRLNKHTRQDTIRLNLLNSVSAGYAETNFEKGVSYADSAIALAQRLGDKSNIARAYFNKGRSYIVKNDFKQALYFSNQSLKLYTELNDREHMVRSMLQIGDFHYNVGDYTGALAIAKDALELANTTKNKLLIATCLNAVGVNYSFLADYSNGIRFHFRQLKIYEQLHDKLWIARTLGNIGFIYYNLKMYPESIKYSLKCLGILTELGDKLHRAAAMNNIGGAYLEMGDYKNAIYYNQQALAINRGIKSRKGAANDLMDIGVSYYNLKQYPLAVDYLDQSIAIYDSLGAKNNLSIALGHLAGIYDNVPEKALISAGINPVNRYQKALNLQLKAVELSKQTKDRNNEANQLRKLSTIYKHEGKYAEALKNYEAYVNLRDSIINDNKKQEIARRAMQYEFDKKEADIKAADEKKQVLAASEISRQKIIRNTFIGIVLILAIAAFITFKFYERRKQAQEQQKEAELKARVAETEMKALRLQLNPHFIFNSLNSISYYISRHDKDMADTYLTKFAKLMRLVLENSEYEEISLADDIKTLELYMQLEALRLNHKLTFEIITGPDIDKENVLVPPMILQPFIENSIWHGIAPKNAPGKVAISIEENDRILICTVDDDGIGRERAAQLKNKGEQNKSFGLKVIQSRLDVINETRKTSAGVKIIDLPEGTRAIITMPYQIKF